MRATVARQILRLFGWTAAGERPKAERFVLIGAPHTSNWDLPLLLLLAEAFDLRVRWMAKHQLFRPPLGWLMRALGGIPVERHRRGNLVTAMADAFQEHERLALVVPAEGTRSAVDYWKSGFYHIAERAKVPIVMGYMDYRKKLGGFGPALEPSGDVASDMDEVRSFYDGITGRRPQCFSVPRLKEEAVPTDPGPGR